MIKPNWQFEFSLFSNQNCGGALEARWREGCNVSGREGGKGESPTALELHPPRAPCVYFYFYSYKLQRKGTGSREKDHVVLGIRSSKPSFASADLCELGQVSEPLCASFSSSIKWRSMAPYSAVLNCN